MNRHPVNAQVTKAFGLIKKGQREKAVTIIAAEGYRDAEYQVQLIELFIAFQAACIEKERRQNHVQRRIHRRSHRP